MNREFIRKYVSYLRNIRVITKKEMWLMISHNTIDLKEAKYLEKISNTPLYRTIYGQKD